ncbi:hypothetical protein ACFE04_002547 [Oxalis oulophora]
MALLTTFITTPTVMAIYKPANGTSTGPRRKLRDFSNSSGKSSNEQLRLLACIHGAGNIPSLINLIESIRSTKKSYLKLFIMHLVELTERSSSIIMAQRARKDGLPFVNRFRRGGWHDKATVSFQAYGQLGPVSVRPITAVSPLSSMHEDICHVAETKGVTMIILPFHKQWNGEGDKYMENLGHGWRGANQKVLLAAPCSVAVLVDRGFGNGGQTPGPNVCRRVCVLFFGGPDDREALELGGRMAEHPAVKVTVVRFIEKDESHSIAITMQTAPKKSSENKYCLSTATMNIEKEKELDETILSEFLSKWDGLVDYRVKSVTINNLTESVLKTGTTADYDLIIVGKGRFPSTLVDKLADQHQPEHAELGPVGDLLASDKDGLVSSVLVIQQHDLAQKELPATVGSKVDKRPHSNYEKFNSEEGSSEVNKDIV